jgi:hypothetical protein
MLLFGFSFGFRDSAPGSLCSLCNPSVLRILKGSHVTEQAACLRTQFHDCIQGHQYDSAITRPQQFEQDRLDLLNELPLCYLRLPKLEPLTIDGQRLSAAAPRYQRVAAARAEDSGQSHRPNSAKSLRGKCPRESVLTR